MARPPVSRKRGTRGTRPLFPARAVSRPRPSLSENFLRPGERDASPSFRTAKPRDRRSSSFLTFSFLALSFFTPLRSDRRQARRRRVAHGQAPRHQPFGGSLERIRRRRQASRRVEHAREGVLEKVCAGARRDAARRAAGHAPLLGQSRGARGGDARDAFPGLEASALGDCEHKKRRAARRRRRISLRVPAEGEALPRRGVDRAGPARAFRRLRRLRRLRALQPRDPVPERERRTRGPGFSPPGRPAQRPRRPPVAAGRTRGGAAFGARRRAQRHRLRRSEDASRTTLGRR